MNVHRFATLLAIIAFVLMSSAMASAQPMAMQGGSMEPMASMGHEGESPEAPCIDRSGIQCDFCCAIMAAAAHVLQATIPIGASFTRVMAPPRTGLTVPPALPPPRER